MKDDLIDKKQKNVLIYIIMLLILVVISCESDDSHVQKSKILEKKIHAKFEENNIPGMAYCAVLNDEVVHAGSQGYANVDDEIAFTNDSRMLIASISKTMAVTATMQLYEDGLLTLTDDINEHLPFEVHNPHHPDDAITIKMLMTHTSSLTDEGYGSFYQFENADYPQTLENFLMDYLTQDGQYYTENNFSINKPGEVFSYSNIAVGLLGYIVERISKQDYNIYCKENIFEPLGMDRTTWFFKDTPQDEIAIPYSFEHTGGDQIPFYSYPTYPDGHLITTVNDLSKFMRAYLSEGTFNGYQLLKPETIDIILQADDQNHNMGLIFYEEEIGNYAVWGHDGGDPGVHTEMHFDVANRIGYILFCNRDELDAVELNIGNDLLVYADQY